MEQQQTFRIQAEQEKVQQTRGLAMLVYWLSILAFYVC